MLTRSTYRDGPLTPQDTRSRVPDDYGVLTASAVTFISTADAKKVLHVSHANDDAYIGKLISGVVSQLEKYCRFDVRAATKRYAWWRSIKDKVELPFGPHTDITKVELTDHDGETSELTKDTHYKEYGIRYKTLEGFEEFGQLYVEFDSGFTEALRPPEFEAAFYQELSLQYKNRQDPDTPAMTSVGNISIEARHLLEGVARR